MPAPEEVKKQKTPHIQWEFHEGESDWNADGPVMSLPLSQPRHRRRRWWLMSGAGLLLFLALTGWLWYRAQLGLRQIDGELKTAVTSDLSSPRRVDAFTATPMITSQEIARNVKQDGKGGKQSPEVMQTRIVDLGDDWAVVEVTMKLGDSIYRQSRVYRRAESGWHPESPAAALWGKPRTLETTYFIFHYFADDNSAVAAAAAKLDILYPTISAIYPPAQSPGAKREIWITPEESPQRTIGNASTSDDGKLEILSPAVNLTPAALNDGDLLAESVVLRLLDQFNEEAIQDDIPDQLQNSQAEAQLRALLQGVRLWQAWSLDLPLSALRKPIVQWIYSDVVPGTRLLPSFDAKLCDLHHLWKDAPLMLQAPLFCGEAGPGDPYQMWRYLYVSPWQMSDRSIFASATPSEPSGDLAAVAGLATVLEYGATTYGPQRIATLIANTPNYSSWETLIPATFGVPLTEFEGGWQSYLHEQYEVELHHTP